MLEHLASMTDAEAYANAVDDPDCPPLTGIELAGFVCLKDIPGTSLLERFKKAQLRQKKQVITARFDADVVNYYKSKGKGYQSIMNAALRACMEAELAARGQHI